MVGQNLLDFLAKNQHTQKKLFHFGKRHIYDGSLKSVNILSMLILTQNVTNFDTPWMKIHNQIDTIGYEKKSSLF